MYERLIVALQALAAPADLQVGRFPSFVVVADELALDFDEALRSVAESRQSKLTGEQREILDRIDTALAAMSGEANARYWTDSALRFAPEWAELRRLAAMALHALGAPVEPPPPSDAVYIPGRTP